METTIDSQNGVSARNNTSKPTRKQRYLPGLPTVSSAKELQEAQYKVLVDRTPSEFAALDNYELFSMSDDGSFLMLKVSKSKAVRLSDRKTYLTGGGRVYRVTLQSHEFIQKNQNQGNG